MFLLLLFFIARIALKRKPFSRVVQEIRGKYCKVAPRSTSSYHKVDWLSSYVHACHDEITYFNRGVFPIRLQWHGGVVDAGQIFVIFLKTKLCNVYYKVDITQILNMFVCLHKDIDHFAKLRILPDREYDNEHDVSIYFTHANNELIVCVI